MIIGTGGSRVIPRNRNEVRRRTLLEVSKGGEEPEAENRDEISARRRAASESKIEAGNGREMKDMSHKTKEKSGRKTQDGMSRKDVPTKILKGSVKISGMDFKTAWIKIVSEKDVMEITSTQRQTLRKFEETNEMLRHFNLLSESTFIDLQRDYQSHVQLLSSLKNDLDQVFHRLRSLKEKMKAKYPEAVQATVEAVQMLKERQRMEMEHEMHKYQSIEAGSTSWTENLPAYSEGSDKFEIINPSDNNKVATNEFVEEPNVTRNEENQPFLIGNVQESEPEANKGNLSNVINTLKAENEMEKTEKNGNGGKCLQNESLLLSNSRNETASDTKHLHADENEESNKLHIDGLIDQTAALKVEESKDELSLIENEENEEIEQEALSNEDGRKYDDEESCKEDGELCQVDGEKKTVEENLMLENESGKEEENKNEYEWERTEQGQSQSESGEKNFEWENS